MRRVFLSLVVIAGLSVSGSLWAGEMKSLVRLCGLSRAQQQKIFSQGFDLPRVSKSSVEAVLTQEEIQKFRNDGVKVVQLIADLNKYIEKVAKTQTKGVEYYTYDKMTQQLQNWATQYEKIARLKSIGKSFEGREIWAMKVSDNPDLDEKEPAALIMGAHHAREWISVEVPMAALKEYLEGYGKDEKLTQLVNEREVWFIPMVNPDGVTYSQTNYQYWRKNRRKIDSRNFGVDLNRNYGYKWGNTGSSNSPSSDVYHGTGPFTEPETQAIKELSEKEHFQAHISYHSYSELVLYPFGYDYDVPCPDTSTLRKLAGEMAKFNKYTPENSADLYPVMGDSDDWGYGANKTLAFTIELATSFIPPASEIEGINKINVPAVFHLIDKSGTYGLTTPSGDLSMAKALDFQTALDAVVDGTALQLDTKNQDLKVQIGDRLLAIGKRLAELVAADQAAGKTDSIEKIRKTPQAGFVLKLISTKLTFDRIYGN